MSTVAARIVPAKEGMAEAVERLKDGRLVAFPTETVYGLGANALDPTAVARIFAAKGRPATNPLIVHVPVVVAARGLSSRWPDAADALADRFWPGPLTLVVEKSAAIPEIVSAGGATVGIRVPNHPVALELLRLSGIPVAAPSANRSEEVSPTTAQHVADSLGPFVDDLLILDGGPTRVGIESTVLDVSVAPPRLLRPGMVTMAMLSESIGAIGDPDLSAAGIARSPGQRARHYAPRAALAVLSRAEIEAAAGPEDAIILVLDPIALLGMDPRASHKISRVFINSGMMIPLPVDAAGYAAGLYEALRTADTTHVHRILVETPPAGQEWDAIHDRLRRAATPKPVDSE